MADTVDTDTSLVTPGGMNRYKDKDLRLVSSLDMLELDTMECPHHRPLVAPLGRPPSVHGT